MMGGSNSIVMLSILRLNSMTVTLFSMFFCCIVDEGNSVVFAFFTLLPSVRSSLPQGKICRQWLDRYFTIIHGGRKG